MLSVYVRIMSRLRPSCSMNINGKKLSSNREGGIEGLPLQLLIIVLVAGVGSAIIMGWMGGLEAPGTIGSVQSSANEIVLIDDDGDGVFTSDGLDLVITVLDQGGDPISGASVTLEGAGVQSADGSRPHALTDDEGKASFEDLTMCRASTSVGFVTVTVAKSGITSTRSVSIPVVCE
jgi:hypothetical protein